jgi:flagellar biosynthesis/type III secretory pathway protein FliH
MKPLRLQTFAPGGAPERVRADAVQNMIEVAREQGYQAGYIAGQAAATEAHFADDRRLTSELVEAIADAQMTNEAARAAVVAEIAPLVSRLFAAIAPSIAEAGLVPEIAARVEEALRRAPGAAPRIRCAPELAGAVEAVLASRGLAGAVEGAPELLPREAEIFWEQGFDRLDLDACIAEIRACIAAHLDPDLEEDSHDRRRYG